MMSPPSSMPSNISYPSQPTSFSGHQHYPNLGTTSTHSSRPQSNSFSGSFGGNSGSIGIGSINDNSSSNSGNRGRGSSFTGNNGNSKQDTAVRTCVEMGFSASRSRQVLEAVGWDVMKAVAVLTDDGPISSGGSSGIGGNSSATPSTPTPPGKKELKFKIPASAKPGKLVTVADKQSGKRYSVRVPENTRPGTELRIFVDK